MKWSDGKPLTNRDVLYSLAIGNVDKSLDHIGLTADNSNIASIKLAGAGKVAINLKAADSTFVGSTLSKRLDRAAAHLVEGAATITKYHEPEPGRLGAVHRVTRFNSQDYVLSKNPNYWQKGLPEDPVRRAGRGELQRCGAAAAA